MDTNQIQTLLKDSDFHYRKRHLKKALTAAQIALDFGKEAGASKNDLIQANLLLARIYNTNGYYQADQAYFQKALQSLTTAEQLLNGSAPQALTIELLLEKGRAHLFRGEYAQAEALFNLAFQSSQKQSNAAGSVLSLAALSEVFMLKDDFDKALQFAKDGLAVLQNSEAADDPALLSEIHNRLSQVLIRKKSYSQSLEHSQTLLDLSRETGDTEKELTALKNIAIVCGIKSNYKIGMQYLLEALDISEDIGFRQNVVQILINIGTIYAHLYNYPEAIRRYQQVLQDYEDILDPKNKVVIYNNLGNIYYSTDATQLACQYFEKAHALAAQHDFKEMVAHSLAQLSRTELKLGNISRAREFATLANDLIEELGDINGKQINLLNLARLAQIDRQINKGIALTKAGISAARALKDDASEVRAYKMLASLYQDRGDFELAMHYQVIYSKTQEEYAKMQRNRQFLDLEIRHAIKEKQKEIEQLTKDNEYQALLLKQSDYIARQNQQLLRANEELRQFAYVASHDLKEPLRMIGSYAQLLSRRIEDKLDENEKVFFQYITDGVSRMNKLLDALLQYATIGKSDEDLEIIPLQKSVEVALVHLKVRIEETGASIDVGDLPEARVYPSQMVQLFQNLISNALKFRRPDTPPVVRIYSEKKDGFWVIHVHDNGIGIPEQSKERVFEIFQRLHGRAEYEGTGIGLSICKKIVERHGGTISVESASGEGTDFYFSLPAT